MSGVDKWERNTTCVSLKHRRIWNLRFPMAQHTTQKGQLRGNSVNLTQGANRVHRVAMASLTCATYVVVLLVLPLASS